MSNNDDSKYEITRIQGRTTLWVDSERAGQCLEYARKHRIVSIGISPERGYRERSLEFLHDAHDVVLDLQIVFPAEAEFDLAPLGSLKALRSLVLSGAVSLDVSTFPKLEVFRGVCHPGLQLSGCTSLRVLDLSKYQPSSKDLTLLPELPALSELVLVQGNLVSLNGISRYISLERVALAYQPKLTSLAELALLPRLTALECDTCRRLEGYEHVMRRMTHLRVLKLLNCGSIDDLAFVRDMTELEEFRFVGTTIVDGDLTPLLRLKRIGFLAKKHYSHTPAQLDAILQKRGE